MLSSTRNFLLLIIIMSLASIVAFLFYQIDKDEVIDLNNAPAAGSDLVEIQTFWNAVLDQTEPQVAYDLFVEHYTKDDENEWHLLMHTFSALLYERLGAEAINICDSAFFYGCYHEVLGNVFQDQGLEAVATMADFCGSVLGCQHGIGHGLVMHFGYTTDRINDALELCKLVDNPEVIDGCLGGVFMEFTTKTMESSIKREHQTSVITKELCQTVIESARPSCHFWLAQWVVMYSDLVEAKDKARSAGEYCASVETQYRDSCFQGIGYMINRFTNTPTETIELCTYASPTGEIFDRDGCLIVAAADYVHYGKNNFAEAVCATVEPDRRSWCPTKLEDFHL